MRKSVSRIGSFANCPYKFKLHYLDELKTIPPQNADNALYLGVAIHEAFETGSVERAIESYRSNFNILTDLHINEEIKLEKLIPKVLAILPPAECEVEIGVKDEFIGFIDRLEHLYTDEKGIKHYAIWDYKYSNNVEHYMESPQLHVYKYYFELTHPNTVVDELKYVFIPKTKIRQKKTETIIQFRQRLIETLEKLEPSVVKVEFDMEMVTQFLQCCQQLDKVKYFPKNRTKLCDWCEFQKYCESNGEIDYMIIEQNAQK